jgi:hypothetical protein
MSRCSVERLGELISYAIFRTRNNINSGKHVLLHHYLCILHNNNNNNNNNNKSIIIKLKLAETKDKK